MAVDPSCRIQTTLPISTLLRLTHKAAILDTLRVTHLRRSTGFSNSHTTRTRIHTTPNRVPTRCNSTQAMQTQVVNTWTRTEVNIIQTSIPKRNSTIMQVRHNSHTTRSSSSIISKGILPEVSLSTGTRCRAATTSIKAKDLNRIVPFRVEPVALLPRRSLISNLRLHR